MLDALFWAGLIVFVSLLVLAIRFQGEKREQAFSSGDLLAHWMLPPERPGRPARRVLISRRGVYWQGRAVRWDAPGQGLAGVVLHRGDKPELEFRLTGAEALRVPVPPDRLSEAEAVAAKLTGGE